MAYNTSSYPPRRNDFNAPRPIGPMKTPDDIVGSAEQVINSLPDRNFITSTKIRKLFGLFTDLYNDIKRQVSDNLSAEEQQKLVTAQIRLVYECGRSGQNSDVSMFVQKAHLLEYLKGIAQKRSEFLRFHQYFEALVAYHRYRFGDTK